MTLFIGEREITPTIITQGGGSADKYKVGDRVNDDSNNPVGTVSSIFFGENNKHYAVVCLDAEHRLWGGKYSDSNTQISSIPLYQDYNKYSNTDSATKNTTAILGQLSSTGCSHCRSKSFTIDGVTYYGQLPNLNELFQICILKDIINSNDPTISSYNSQKIPTSAVDFASGSSCVWSSTQRAWNGAFGLTPSGEYFSSSLSRTTAGFIIPVLEIPLEN